MSQAVVRPTAAATATLLQQRDEFVSLELAITEDGGQEPRADGLPGVDRQPGHATVIFWTPTKSSGSTLSP